MYCYTIFRQKKIELLQDYLNSRETLEYEDISFTNDPYSFGLDLEIEVQISEFENRITEQLSGDYQWDDISAEDFDYSILQYHLEDYLQWKYDSFSYEDEAHDRWEDSQLEERDSLESILNKPLL